MTFNVALTNGVDYFINFTNLVSNTAEQFEEPSFPSSGTNVDVVNGYRNGAEQARVYQVKEFKTSVEITGIQGKAFKASTQQFETAGFIGFAQTAANLDDNVKIGGAGIDSNQSGLTIGAQYYLTDTPGVIGTVPGS